MKPTINFDKVGKKFSKGYVSDSLRDAITAPFRSLFSRDGSKPTRQKNEFWALKEVSFEVMPGEALGIIGPNGSGKSTALKLLSKILRPDAGIIKVAGRIGALIELGAGFHPDLTGRENVFLNASILGMSKDEINKKYDEIVDFAELHEFMDTPVRWYSSGMFARLGFSVAAHTDPQILIVDEVLSVGDWGFQRKCLDRMEHFKALGVTIVFVSHNMQSVASLCDRIVLLKKGVVEKTGETEGTLSYYMGGFKRGDSSSSTKVELKKGAMYNEKGDECLAFKCGQKARVEIALKFNESLANVQVTIGVLKRKEQLVSWINSSSLSGQSLSVSGGQTVNLSVDFLLNLTSGEYEFKTTVYDPIKNKTIWEDFFAPFVIQRDTRSSGIVFMNPRLISQVITAPGE